MRLLSSIVVVVVLSVIPNVPPVKAQFSQSFQNFIVGVPYFGGNDTLQLLLRSDIPNGSFGGGDHIGGTTTVHRPVIFVHDFNSSAADLLAVRDYFKVNGNYSDEELFATSYGAAPAVPNAQVRCDYLFAVRMLSQNVLRFTNHTGFDVVAYGSGVPVLRKAMMGDECVEAVVGSPRSVYGFSPFSWQVTTFVSVAGVVYGVPACDCAYSNCSSCAPGSALCSLSEAHFGLSCSSYNGVKCGSRIMNATNRFTTSVPAVPNDGTNRFSILSTDDEVIGYEVCGGKISGILPFAQKNSTLSGLNHLETMYNTYDLQLSYIVNLAPPS